MIFNSCLILTKTYAFYVLIDVLENEKPSMKKLLYVISSLFILSIKQV